MTQPGRNGWAKFEDDHQREYRSVSTGLGEKQPLRPRSPESPEVLKFLGFPETVDFGTVNSSLSTAYFYSLFIFYSYLLFTGLSGPKEISY